VAYGNGTSQTFAFDGISRLSSLAIDTSGTAGDLSQTFAYNPASQIASTTRTGDSYAWTGHYNENKTGVANGLNQLTNVGAKSLTHDPKGNVTAFGTKSFTYSSENLLLTGPGSTTLNYDPGMRLYQSVSGGTTQHLAYDGLDRIAEYDGSNALQRRYVHGPSVDEPLVWYEGTGTTDRRFLGSDERGSVISVTDSSGTVLGLNKYDEFGQPQSTNLGVWGYTGQAWLPTISVWYYKARDYDPELGRLLQTDPIDMLGGINLYAYAGNDPINLRDPLGFDAAWSWSCYGNCSTSAGYWNTPVINMYANAGGLQGTVCGFVIDPNTGGATDGGCSGPTNDPSWGAVPYPPNLVWQNPTPGPAPDAMQNILVGIDPNAPLCPTNALTVLGSATSKVGALATYGGATLFTAGVVSGGIGAATLQPEIAFGGAALAILGEDVTAFGVALSTLGAFMQVMGGSVAPAAGQTSSAIPGQNPLGDSAREYSSAAMEGAVSSSLCAS
jgi:RHS repeat-associated protein